MGRPHTHGKGRIGVGIVDPETSWNDRIHDNTTVITPYGLAIHAFVVGIANLDFFQALVATIGVVDDIVNGDVGAAVQIGSSGPKTNGGSRKDIDGNGGKERTSLLG